MGRVAEDQEGYHLYKMCFFKLWSVDLVNSAKKEDNILILR